jgi:hypothetical protein
VELRGAVGVGTITWRGSTGVVGAGAGGHALIFDALRTERGRHATARQAGAVACECGAGRAAHRQAMTTGRATHLVNNVFAPKDF